MFEKREQILYYNENMKINEELILKIKTNKIKKLKFGNHFNQEIDNLPDGITHIYFGEMFNQQINNLPNTITHIYFGDYYNKPLNYLPSTIKFIKFGLHYNLTLENLNFELEHISIPTFYENNIKNLPNIKKLELGMNFYGKCDIPKSLEYLYINNDYDLGNINVKKLKYLYLKIIHVMKFKKIIDNLIQNIKKLRKISNIILKIPLNINKKYIEILENLHLQYKNIYYEYYEK